MSTRIGADPSATASDDKVVEKDLGFYFAGSGDMLRKLESSKPVRRTRTDKNKVGGVNGAAPEASNTQEPNYLFKWQREGGEEDDDDEEEVVADKSNKAARWAVVSGNVPPSQLSIAAYYEKKGLKGKQLRDGLVNCGGVIMVPPVTLSELKSNGTAVYIPVLHDRAGEGDGLNTDELLRDDFESSAKGAQSHGAYASQEVLMLHRTNVVWPPEPPGFPPPPPDPNDVVVPKKVSGVVGTDRRTDSAGALCMDSGLAHSFNQVPVHQVPTVVRRLSRVNKSQMTAVPRTGGNPAAKLAVVSETRQAHSDSVSTSLGSDQLGQRQAASTQQPDGSVKDPRKQSFMRRISFLPAALTAKPGANQYPNVYASNILVPYMLPPPCEPLKCPPAGSNDERKLAKLSSKKMFLEDLYSQMLEHTAEKRRLNEACREMEQQITEADVQISQLLAQE